MKYQWKIKATFKKEIVFYSANQVDTLLVDVLKKCLLTEEYYDGDWKFMAGEPRPGQKSIVQFVYDFKTEVEDEWKGGPISKDNEEAVEEAVRKLVVGSGLVDLPLTVKYQLDDQQPDLDSYLNWINEYEPWVVTGDAAQYHYDCAVERYGEKELRKAVEGKSDYLSVQYGYEFRSYVWNCLLSDERADGYCDVCNGHLYDGPVKEEEHV